MSKPPFNMYSGLEFPAYSFQEYPKWAKNAKGEEKIVNDKEEFVAFVGDFVDTSQESPLEKEIRLLREENDKLKAEAAAATVSNPAPDGKGAPVKPALAPAPVEKPKG